MPHFHLPIREITINLDDVSCLLHLPIRQKLLDHKRLDREEASEMLVTYLGADPTKAENEVADTKCAHSRFKLLEGIYIGHPQMVVDADIDDM